MTLVFTKNTIASFSLEFTEHAKKMAELKHFSMKALRTMYKTPTRVYPSGSHPGQYRVTGNGYCLVGMPVERSFRVITVYLDEVITPPRPDQLNTSQGRLYAEKYKSWKCDA